VTPTQLGDRLGATLRTILTGDTLELVRKGIQAAKEAYGSLVKGRSQGIYEVLRHDTTLHLVDGRGNEAIVERVESVRFLQDYVSAFTDYAWGDGDIFAEYRCSPGVPVDFYQDGSRRAVLISLRETKRRGEELTFRIHRLIRGGFLSAEECWETEVYHRTKELSVAVLFPRERRCRSATVTQRSTSVTVALGAERFRFLEDGRQELTWELANPRLHERYSLKWRW